jgi:phospholipid/cholesterol/gamma-HCH transport system substrate-binding protein
MKNTLETRVGIFVAAIALAAVLIIEILGGLGQFRKGIEVFAYFESARELKIGDRVKLAGVDIGKVKSIELTTNQAVRITLQIRREAPVTTKSVASIGFAGLLGQNFVELSFGSVDAPRIEPGSVLTSLEQPTFATMMTKLDNAVAGVENLTKSFSGDKIDNLFGPITDFLRQNSEPLSASLVNLSNITGQIAAGEGTVGKLIYDNHLHDTALTSLTNMQGVIADAEVALADAKSIIADVRAGQGTIGLLLQDQRLYGETAESMTNLKEILQKVNRGEGSICQLVNEQEFYDNAKLALQKLEKSVESLEDTGPLSVLGLAIGNLF